MKKTALLLLPFLLLTACKKAGVDVNDPGIGTEKVIQAMPQGGEIVHPDYGRETWLAVGPLSGTEETPANGVAQGHLFEDGTYSHSIQVNIAVAPEGYFYEGWLMNPKTQEMVSTGHLHNNFGDVRHYLDFEDKQDLQAHMNVVITLEPDDGDPAPSTRVAEGLMKVRQR